MSISSTYDVICADIGSVAKGSFGWAASVGPDGESVEGTDIAEVSDLAASCLNRGRKVALGFECPLFVPIPDDPACLTSKRPGEGSRPWSAGGGLGALATGLTEVPWILLRIRAQLSSGVPAFLKWREFCSASNGLFLWEAFVTGDAKGASHCNDAAIAVGEFRRVAPDIDDANAVKVPVAMSLVGAALLRSGWTADLGVLEQTCVVIKPAG